MKRTLLIILRFLIYAIVVCSWLYIPASITIFSLSYFKEYSFKTVMGSLAFIAGLFIVGYIWKLLIPIAERLTESIEDLKKG